MTHGGKCLVCRVYQRSSTSHLGLLCTMCERSIRQLPEDASEEEVLEWAVTRALKLAPRRQKEVLVRVRCTHCKKKITRKRGELRHQRINHPDWKVFCSRQCAGKYRKKEHTPKVCQTCGDEFVKARAYDHERAVYCSDECRRNRGTDD